MKTPLHVVMLMHDYLPLGGGAETQVAALGPVLRDYGVNISVLARRYPGLKAHELIDDIPVYRILSPGPRMLKSLSYTLLGTQLTGKLKPDLIHAHTFISPATTGLVAKSLFGKPFVLTAHSRGEYGDVRRLQKKRSGIQRLQALKKQVDAFVCISSDIDNELAEIGVPADRRHFIPNGVDAEHFQPLSMEKQKQLRTTLDIPENAQVAIFAGRLAPIKRVNNLLTVWKDVKEAYPESLLLILGSGELENELKQMAGEGVRFTGRVNNVSDYLQVADVFVLPSLSEALSISMLEAMACSLPVVITRVGGASDAIEHKHSGWLIEPDNLSDLKEAILNIFDDEALRYQLGKNARERILRDFHLPIIASRLRALYDELLKQQSAS